MLAMHWIYFVKLQRAIGRFSSHGIFVALMIHMAFKSIQSEYRKKPAFYRYRMQVHLIPVPILALQQIMQVQRATQRILQ